MNLGNQNSKYSWRIRDLKNPQTGTQFANSVLMYKIDIVKNCFCPKYQVELVKKMFYALCLNMLPL